MRASDVGSYSHLKEGYRLGSAGASQGTPPARSFLVGRAALYQGNLPAFLGQPGQSSHHLTSLSSHHLPGPGWVILGHNLAMALGFPPGWHFSMEGQPPLTPSRPPLLVSWHKNNNIL